MRGQALALKDAALTHAELVLLVDDDQAEVGELDILLDQGLSADGQVDFPFGQIAEDGGLGLAAWCGW